MYTKELMPDGNVDWLKKFCIIYYQVQPERIRDTSVPEAEVINKSKIFQARNKPGTKDEWNLELGGQGPPKIDKLVRQDRKRVAPCERNMQPVQNYSRSVWRQDPMIEIITVLAYPSRLSL